MVITGPNGGGKSNVFDAVRFALGELSQHELRVSKFSDLIHDPGDGVKDGYARVSIVLENQERKVPIDSNEVTISRKVVQSGESEYQINGRTMTRSDLLNTLSAAHIAHQGFNIVPQGSVISIAEMNPAEMRRLLDQASGLDEYDTRKEEASAQLAVAEKNLDVARASTTEVKSRVKQLEVERNQFLRKQFAENYVKRIQSSVILGKLNQLRNSLTTLDQNLVSESSLSNQIDTKERELSERKKNMYQMWHDLDQQISDSKDLNQVDKQLVELDSRLIELRVRKNNFSYLFETLSGDRNYLTERVSSLAQQIAQAEEIIDALETSCKSLEQQIHGLPEEVEVVEKTLPERMRIQARFDEIKAQIQSLSQELFTLSANQSSSKASKEYLESQLEELRKKKTVIAGEKEQTKKALDELASQLHSIELRLGQLSATRESILSDIKSLSELMNEAGILLADFNSDSRSEDLTSHPIQKILLELCRSEKLHGTKGTIADHMTYRENGRLTKAFLGALQEAYVCSDLATGSALARILLLSKVPSQIIVTSVPDGKPETRSLSNKFSTLAESFSCGSKDLYKSLRRILGKVAVVGDEEQVPSVLAANLSAITMDGLLYTPDGVIVVSKTHSSPLSGRYSDLLDEIGELLEALRSNLKHQEGRFEEVSAEIEALSRSKAELEEKKGFHTLKLAVDEESLAGLQHSRTLTDSRLANLVVDTEQNDSSLRSARDLLAALESESAKVGDSLRQIEENLKKEEEGRIARTSTRDRLLSELNAIQREVQARREFLYKLIVERQSVNNLLASKEKELSNLSSDHDGLDPNHTEIQEAIVALQSRRQILAAGIDLKREERKQVRIGLDEIESELAILSGERSRLQEHVRQLRDERSSVETEIKLLEQKLETIGYSGTGAPLVWTGEDAERIYRSLQDEYNQLSMVNQLAPSQFEEIVKNYKVRSIRISELELERKEILAFMKQIDEERIATFKGFFEKVSAGFQEFFRQLTGGTAGLVLSEESNPLTSGVEMVLQFEGKAARVSSGVSGGEKSVAAVALLFSLQGLTPAAFYVFDEVDAHMDIKYSENLAQLLRRLSAQTQIVLITLKDIIAERANELIGVYMSSGESRAVKSRLTEQFVNE